MNACLLIQFLDKPPLGPTPMERIFSTICGPHFFAIDNFSDSTSSQVALSWMEECDRSKVILWQEGTKTGQIQPFLNFLLKHRNTSELVTNTTLPMVEKLAKVIPVTKVYTAEELFLLFRST